MNEIIGSIPFYLSKQISDMVSSDPSIINLSIGEPYFMPPRVLDETFRKEILANDPDERRISYKYSDSKGSLNLRREIVKRYKNEYDCELDERENVLITHGACEAIWLSILTLTSSWR